MSPYVTRYRKLAFVRPYVTPAIVLFVSISACGCAGLHGNGAAGSGGKQFHPGNETDDGASNETDDGASRKLAAELRAVLDDMESAMRRSDLAAVAAAYADDAILISPGGRRTVGREAVDAYWEGFGRGIDWQLDVRDTGGDGERGIAYQRGQSTLTYARNDETRVSIVQFVLLWQRDAGGRWKIALDAYW